MKIMSAFRFLLLVVLFTSVGSVFSDAQTLGSVEVSGRVKIGGKQEKLSRKRFYLIKGGLKDNIDLVTRLRSAKINSRDCFYTQMQASPQFICWLQAENCESPFCRTVATDDINRVPEFQASYKKGLTQFKGLTNIAHDWILTNMPPTLTSGFFRERRTLTDNLLGTIKPLQSSMTDSVTVKAIFMDVPVAATESKKTQTYLISNILPIEFGVKSYLWACEIEVGTEKRAVVNLLVPEPGKTVKNCEVFVNDLQVCKTESCKAT